ncbi:PAS domain-containing sensor histidine kinase [Mucilaginibacter sp.]|uniref:PAS domain-containing sensor histidine kinase n=1 Tax=Mucilaginibacter sp. TaxID=1882438 RepID=UPI002CDC54B1|nr:PAS domain-containing sensor histidine kinase [Mucilaginibacter sp.]HTI59986.1 PAS domain-containing sensor histidine kinase [Mucilaginibacter sp.]
MANRTTDNDNYDAATAPQAFKGSIYPEMISFFNALDEVFFTVDMVDMRVMQISNACEKLFGYKQADFLADPLFWFGLVHPDDRHIIDSEDPILRRGEKVSNEYRIIRKDKSICWVENKVVPMLDDTGRLIRIDGVTRDITPRRDAEEKHRQSESRYRQIVETAQEGIWTIDENERTNFVNKKMADILGYQPEEMMGKGLYDFMDDEGREYAIACMERRRKGSKENLDVRYQTKDGRDVWANISANPIFDENGKYKGALAMVTDITQRKADEQALKKSEANLRTIFDNTDTAYVLFNTDLVIMSFNALAQKYSTAQNRKPLVINESVKAYFSDDRWPFISEILERVSRGETANYELNYTREGGSVQWNDVRWLNVKDEYGKNWGFILANKDITEAKQATLERERITADLIQHNKDLEQFTYIISHNLRAPVANIIALADMLKENEQDAAARKEVVDKVSHAIKNMDTVIKDLNQVLQARELVNEKKEVICFRELMDTIRTSIYNVIVNEHVQFRCLFDEAESIFSIRRYLYSIFYNLASNSIKYHKPGIAPIITVKSHRLKNKIELRFKDNGKGIDLEKYGLQLFGLYKRFDNTVEGKGMGLFMVKTQVEALGGTIRVKSKPGEGCEFIIQLPA